MVCIIRFMVECVIFGESDFSMKGFPYGQMNSDDPIPAKLVCT